MRSIVSRIERLEETKLLPAVAAANIPNALDTLSPEDRVLVIEYKAARERGDREFPAEMHRAQRRYLEAVVERERLLKAAGVPIPSYAETLRALSRRRPQNTTQEGTQQWEA